MSIDTSGPFWKGTQSTDLEPFMGHFLGDHDVENWTGRILLCTQCNMGGFSVLLDDEEGCAQRTCLNCGHAELFFDSADTSDVADLGDAACPCDNEEFNVAAACELAADREVERVFIFLRCLECGTMALYTDWSIDYVPSAILVDMM